MYAHARNGIIAAGFNPEVVEAIGSSLSHAKSLLEARGLLRAFADEAEKLPWPQDHDFGALVLQAESRNASSLDVKKFMLIEAISRAQWCASCSTSGGEGLARMVHVNDLKAELLACG